jgi:hypothetical protein
MACAAVGFLVWELDSGLIEGVGVGVGGFGGEGVGVYGQCHLMRMYSDDDIFSY